jgi:hypothetical protein
MLQLVKEKTKTKVKKKLINYLSWSPAKEKCNMLVTKV